MTGAVSNISNQTSNPSTTSKDRTSLASNFQTFLTLLTTQLQNQDPTSPMDSNEFTQQLVMYSQVEQQIDTNDKLDSLLQLSGNQTSNLAMSYLGKNVVLTDGTGQLMNGSAKWNYGLDNDAKNCTLTVKNAAGEVVYSKTLEKDDKTAGVHNFSWDGKDSNGNPMANGAYTLTVSATAADGSAVKSSVASTVPVTGVDFSGSSPQLVVGTFTVPLSSVSMVAYPTSGGSNTDTGGGSNNQTPTS